MAISKALGSLGTLAAATTLKVQHESSPGGNALYLVKSAFGGFYFASNNASTANDVIELADGEQFIVVHNTNAASNLGGVAVYALESATGTENVLQAAVVGGKDAYIVSHSTGRTLKVVYKATPTDGIAIKFDQAEAEEKNRFQATAVGEADLTAYTSSVFALAQALS